MVASHREKGLWKQWIYTYVYHSAKSLSSIYISQLFLHMLFFCEPIFDLAFVVMKRYGHQKLKSLMGKIFSLFGELR